MNRLIRVLIVDDDELMLSGLELIVQYEENMKVSGTARNGLQALDLIKQDKPDIVLLDLEMPVMNGLDCIVEIRKLHADLPILVLSSFGDDNHVYQGLAYGANGYVLKGTVFDKLGPIIRDVMNDQFVLSAEVGRRLAQFVMTRSDQTRKQSIARYLGQSTLFTKHEQDLIQLLLTGLTNKEIAEELFFSVGTIKHKLTVIYEKIGVTSREDAIRYFEERSMP